MALYGSTPMVGGWVGGGGEGWGWGGYRGSGCMGGWGVGGGEC